MKLSAQEHSTAIYMLKLATTHLLMPVLRSEHQRRPLLVLDGLDVRPILEQCAGDLLEMV